MVTGQVVGDVVTAGAARVNELVVRRDALEGLQVEYREQQGRVADAEGRSRRRDRASGRPLRRGRCRRRPCRPRGQRRRRRLPQRTQRRRRCPGAGGGAETSGGEGARNHNTCASRRGRGRASTTTPPPATPETTDGGEAAVVEVGIGTSRPQWNDGDHSFRRTSQRVASTRRSRSCNVRASETPMPTTHIQVRLASISSSHRPGPRHPPAPASPAPAPSTARRISGPPPGLPRNMRSLARVSGALGPVGGSWDEP